MVHYLYVTGIALVLCGASIYCRGRVSLGEFLTLMIFAFTPYLNLICVVADIVFLLYLASRKVLSSERLDDIIWRRK